MPDHTPQYYQEQIHSLTRIPSLSVIATELMQVMEADNLSVNQILQVIERDPPLAMRVLKIANSAYYGLHSRVESLQHALVIIGMEALRDLSMGFLILRSLADSATSDTLRWNRLWEHSAAVGHIAQLLQIKLGIQTAGSPYAMGLLHDIGKIILFRLAPEKYLEAYTYALEHNISANLAEKQIIGIDHTMAGAWVAQQWLLPDTIYSAIKFHHAPLQVADKQLRVVTALIQLADIVANLQFMGFGRRFLRSIPSEEASWQILRESSTKFETLDFERFVMSIEDELSAIKSIVQLSGRA